MEISSYVASERETGLISGDHDVYRAQTSRRIHSLRKRLGQATPKGRKYASKPSITAGDIGRDTQYVKLLLMSAERSWASAMAMKSAQSPDNTQKKMAGSTRRQINSRLSKAISYAHHLLEELRNSTVSKANNRDLLEATAYLSALKGALYFEKTKWDPCIQEYSICRVIYVTLSSGSGTDIYKEQLSNTVDTSLRYAAYQLRFPRTKAISDIAIEQFPQEKKDLRARIETVDPQAFSSSQATGERDTELGASLPSTITWRQKTVKIEDASIAQAIATADKKEAEAIKPPSKARNKVQELAAAYDDVINSRQEAVDATKSAIDELVAERVDLNDARLQSLQLTRTAINYAVIELRVGRSRVLCGPQDGACLDSSSLNSAGPSNSVGKGPSKEESVSKKLVSLRERLALYDSILQNIDAVTDLSGIAGDASFVEDIAGRRAYFRALRCLALARSHALIGKTTSALALYHRSLETIKANRSSKEPQKSAEKESLLKLNIDMKLRQDIQIYLENLVSKYRALVEIETVTEQRKASRKDIFQAPLAERLDQYPIEDVDLTNLVNFPPKLRPIPVKPLFFDLAWNYIDYPGRPRAGDSNEQSAPDVGPDEKQAPAKRGWFGFGR